MRRTNSPSTLAGERIFYVSNHAATPMAAGCAATAEQELAALMGTDQRNPRPRSVGKATLSDLPLRLQVRDVHRVGPVQSVEEAQVAVIALELLVMEVVEVGLVVEAHRPRHPEAGVVHLRADDSSESPHHREEQVAAAWIERGSERKQIAHEELERVAVNGDEADGGRELVMLLMEALVQKARVHRPVRVEEKHLVA